MTNNKPHPPRKIPRREFLKLAAAGAVGALAGCCPTLPKTGDLALVGGTLIDGTGAIPLPDAVVTTRGGRIAAVGTSAQVEVPKTARAIDVGGATILPGFINAHVHAAYDEDTLKAWAQGGVTTVRDMGAGGPYSPKLFDFRDEANDKLHCARLVAVGSFVNVAGGYPIAYWGGHAVTIDSPEDARQKVHQVIDDGTDVIKTAIESGASFGQSGWPILSPEEAAAIVEAAHERDTPVSVHVTISQDLERALDAGMDDIAHMVADRVSDELIERMIKADTYWVPTLELWHGVSSVNPVNYITQAINNLGRFVEAGGKVALGTDYGGYKTEFDLGMPIREIEWMQEAGMMPLQIIVAATKHAAHVCNLGQETGTLEVGKAADILVVDDDPLKDIHALTETKMVFREGVSI